MNEDCTEIGAPFCEPVSGECVRCDGVESVVVSRDAASETMCPSLDASYSATESMLGGVGNIALGDMDVSWFSDFNAGDFHLTMMAPIEISTDAMRMVDEDCTEIGAPFCEPVSGECVRCDGLEDGDAACAGLDPFNTAVRGRRVRGMHPRKPGGLRRPAAFVR